MKTGVLKKRCEYYIRLAVLQRWRDSGIVGTYPTWTAFKL